MFIVNLTGITLIQNKLGIDNMGYIPQLLNLKLSPDD